MLVLTRKTQETIVIGGNVKVTILRVKGQSVRIGVEAPKSVRVMRGELTPQDKGDRSDEDAHRDQEDPSESSSMEDPLPMRLSDNRTPIPDEEGHAEVIQFRFSPLANFVAERTNRSQSARPTRLAVPNDSPLSKDEKITSPFSSLGMIGFVASPSPASK